METGLCSYLLPLADFHRLHDPEGFWFAIHNRGREVDHLPGYTEEMMELLLDYVATEYRIKLPRQVDLLQAVPVILAMTRHEAQVFRGQLKKTTCDPASHIFRMYGKAHFEGGKEWTDFLTRQGEHFCTDEEGLVILAIDRHPTLRSEETVR